MLTSVNTGVLPLTNLLASADTAVDFADELATYHLDQDDPHPGIQQMLVYGAITLSSILAVAKGPFLFTPTPPRS